MLKKKSTAVKKVSTPKAITPKGGEITAKASFSMTFLVKDKSFIVKMDDITNIVKNGLELKLDEPMDLGSFADFYSWAKEKIAPGIPDLAELQKVKILDQFMSGEIKILTFNIKTPGTENKKQHYDVSVSITFKKEEGITIVGPLKLSQLNFGVNYVNNAG